MKALRATLVAVFVFVPLLLPAAGCRRKPAEQSARPAPGGS